MNATINPISRASVSTEISSIIPSANISPPMKIRMSPNPLKIKPRFNFMVVLNSKIATRIDAMIPIKLPKTTVLAASVTWLN